MKTDSSKNLSEPIYQHLLDMILSNQIKPGDKIPEGKLAAQFNISRTPIRDALKQLANDGIINIYPNRFAEVANWDDDMTVQVGVARVAIDNMLAKLSIYHGSNAEFKSMLAASERCKTAALAGDVAGRIKADCAFHSELGTISKNRQLAEYQKNIYLKVEFLQSFRSVFFVSPEEQHKQHCDIVAALMDRDDKRALTILTNHNIQFHDIGNDYPASFFLSDIV